MRTVAGEVRPTTSRSRPIVGASRKWGSVDGAASDVPRPAPAPAPAPRTGSATASASAPSRFAARWSAEVVVELKAVLGAVRGLPRALAVDVAQVAGAGAGHDGPAAARQLAVERPMALDHEAAGLLSDRPAEALEADERRRLVRPVAHHPLGGALAPHVARQVLSDARARQPTAALELLVGVLVPRRVLERAGDVGAHIPSLPGRCMQHAPNEGRRFGAQRGASVQAALRNVSRSA